MATVDARIKLFLESTDIDHLCVRKKNGLWEVTAFEHSRSITHRSSQLGRALNALLCEYELTTEGE